MLIDKDLEFMTFRVNDGFAQIQLKQISHFIIKDSRTKAIYFNGDEKTIVEKMKYIETILNEHDFVRIHQNCIVNFKQEMSFCQKNRTILLHNNCKVTVAKERIMVVKHKLLSNI
jgi:DNA-binding LytR/AlgR family response regulator